MKWGIIMVLAVLVIFALLIMPVSTEGPLRNIVIEP